MKQLILAVVIVLSTGCATTQNVSSNLNDPLATTVKITTHDYDAPMLNSVNVATSQDIFYRGTYDKQTKKQRNILYVVIRDHGDFQDWNKLVYLDSDGARQVLNASRIHYDAKYGSGVTSYFEDMVITVSDEQLAYFAQKDITVRMESGRTSGKHKDIIVYAAETKLFLQRINALNQKIAQK